MLAPSAHRPRRAPARALALTTGIAAALAMPALASSQDPSPAPAAPPVASPGEPAPITLRRGDTGPAVSALQRALAGRGHEIAVDGEFGSRTVAAVTSEQTRIGQEGTGVADPVFLSAIGLDLRAPTPPTCTAAGAAADPSGGRTGRWLRVFPLVGEYSYTASFGDRRHQGSHEGVDIMAERGTPAVSVADANVDRLTRSATGLGGIWVWLRDGTGTEYYYAHLDTIADGLAEGDRVGAGQPIGTVGNTGDARYGAPHLHFEVHPGGGGAADPYPDLRAVDPGSGNGTLADGCAVAAPAAGAGSSRVELSVRQLGINQRIAQTAVRRVNRLSARVSGDAAPAGDGSAGSFSLSRRQLLINQRIAQAAIVRARRLEARLDGRPAAAPGSAGEGGRVTLSRRQMLINQRVSQAAIRKANALRPRVESERSAGS